MDLPDHPFWDFSLVAYEKPGVADACLSFQDEFNLDVNLLLLCLWCGAAGPGRLDLELIKRCVADTISWQEQVVKPLRQARRAFKAQSTALSDDAKKAFKSQLQSVELNAEHIEQLILGEVLQFSRNIVRGEEDAFDNVERTGIAVVP